VVVEVAVVVEGEVEVVVEVVVAQAEPVVLAEEADRMVYHTREHRTRIVD
jgi:hypothetical protein